MVRFWKKFSVLLETYYAHMLEFRAEILLWALSGSFPIILLGVWVKASQSGDFSLSPAEFARYFFCIFLVRQFTTIWVIWEFEQEILEGRLSARLLQPLDPAWHHVAGHLSEKITRIPFILLLGALFFWLYPQARWLPNLENLLLCVVGVVLAFMLRFIIQYTFAMFAFWTERASAIQEFWFLFYLFFSGNIAPLEVFPPAVRELVLLTPFPYTLYFPVALLLDLPVAIARSFVTIFIWMSLFFCLNRWLWRRGLKHYSAMGA